MPDKPDGDKPANDSEVKPSSEISANIASAPKVHGCPTTDHKSHENLDACKKSDMSGWKPSERWNTWIAGVTCGAGIIVAFIYGFQLSEMRKSTDATTKAAVAAEKAANLAEEANRNFRIDERPYIVVDSIETENKPAIGDHFPIHISMRNAGKTPALDSEIFFNAYTGVEEINDSSDLDNIIHRDSRPLNIGAGVTYRPTITFGPGLTGEIVEKINSGKLNIYVRGLIIYKDIFSGENVHRTRFSAMYYVGEGIMKPTKTGNKIE